MPKAVKETFYFAENYGMGEAWYKNHFRHYDPSRHRRIIDVSPTLFQNHKAIARVRESLHDPVLLATLRRPIERTWSHYMHLRQYGKTTLGFDDAVRKIPSLVEPSLYAKHLFRWMDKFGRDAVRIAFYNDLKQNQAEFVRQVNETFGLPCAAPQALPTTRVNPGSLPRSLLFAQMMRRTAARLRRRGLHRIVNAGKRVGLSNLVYGRSRGTTTRPTMRADTRCYLIERFAGDVDDLERLLDINLDAWREQWTAAPGESRRA